MNELVEKARQKALDVLKPTEAQLEHGLELHRELTVCDSFSFLPNVWAKDVVDELAEMREQELGARQWAWESGMLRGIAGTGDPEAGKEFLDAIETSGLTCLVQTVAEGKSREQDIKRMA